MAAFSLHTTVHTLLAKSGYNKLERREQRIVLAGIIFILCLALFHFAVSPLLEGRQRAQKSVIQKKEDLVKIRQLQEEYHRLQNQTEEMEKRLQKRNPSFTLFSFIEERATQAKVKEQINSMTPSTSEGDGMLQESRVDLKLEHISLQQLVDFLQQVESAENAVMIKRISIQESNKDEGSLDAVMQIITFTKKSGS